jgi:hypothetical protein
MVGLAGVQVQALGIAAAVAGETAVASALYDVWVVPNK